ncbi:TerD family protein [Streptomyces sp. NPDC001787]|uniref:TerD family protein n=1 Tax=Streptomyces sp. NPDC001787 TaxID=3154523 RepID=UPI003322FA21
MVHRLGSLVTRHTHRVPRPIGPVGEGTATAQQLDAALMSVGFKLSAELLAHLSGLSRDTVLETATETLETVREMVGDHVRHNVYFIDFPANVPDTLDFWMQCIAGALADDEVRTGTLEQLSADVVNLLMLPAYGNYRHAYAEMLAHHDELIASAGDRVTVLHLGDDLDEEIGALYLALAGSTTPLSEDGLRDLQDLAVLCTDGPQPAEIPVRENRAVVNQARLAAGSGLQLDTVTDVLRLACAFAGGDVTLQEPTRLRTLPRPVRRALLAGLDKVIAAAPAKLADVAAHREMWKRLGERLHPHEYPQWPHAADVFAVARGEKTARSLDSRVGELLDRGDITAAVKLLNAAPGRLLRALDLLLRDSCTQGERDTVVAAAERALPEVSGRVLLSVREHLHNRQRETGRRRVFVNRFGRAWATGDNRRPVPAPERQRLDAALDAELRRRLPAADHLLIDPEVLDVALPLSGKATASGLGVLPRGSVSPVNGKLLRFFVYWKQSTDKTDYDLSAALLNADYSTSSWLSYTNLRGVGGEHSGDITDAPDGASEFINLRLGAVRAAYIVPQVNIFSGEGFDEVEESFFGFMLRKGEQKGRPFEPRTVRMKSELRGPGRVALPLVFLRGPGGRWRAKWLHLHLKGTPASNRVEYHRVTLATLLRAFVEREQLTVRHLTGLMTSASTTITFWDGTTVPAGPVTYIGLQRPAGLHPESKVVTLVNLRDLIPA